MWRWPTCSGPDLRRCRAGRTHQGRAYPHARTEKTLLELEFIVDQLSDFYEPNEARQWIFAPQKLLRGALASRS